MTQSGDNTRLRNSTRLEENMGVTQDKGFSFEVN